MATNLSKQHLIGVVIGYNEYPTLERTVRHLQQICGRVIYVDGAYKDFPIEAGSFQSTDGSTQLAKMLGAEVVEGPTDGWADQQTKRNQYLKGKPGDWYFMLDCDETFDYKEYLLDPQYPGYRVYVMELEGGRNDYIRFFKHVDGLAYQGWHDGLAINGKIIELNECPVLRDVQIFHHRLARPQARLLAASEYYYRQSKIEGLAKIAYNTREVK